MLIADARSLFEPQPTGVTEVAAQFISALQRSDPSLKLVTPQPRTSNTLTNVQLALGVTTIENLVGAPRGETHTLFLPNVHFVHTRPETRVVQLVHDISFIDSSWWYSRRVRLWHWFAHARAALLRANILCAVSEFTKQRLVEELLIDPTKIFVVPPCTPLPLPEKKPLLPFPEDQIFFLVLGTREQRKNSAGILEAFYLFQKSQSYRGEHLLFVGRTGHGAPRISSHNRQVHALSYCSPAEKWWLLRHARALLYPSFYEGFGLPPLEAGAVGTPSLIADVTAPHTTMGAGALLVSPYDIREMALGIEALAVNDVLHAELARRATARAAEFTPKNTRAHLQTALAALS